MAAASSAAATLARSCACRHKGMDCAAMVCTGSHSAANSSMKRAKRLLML
jgi:hypothetical protein